MKIAIVSCVFPPYGGGIGIVAYHHALFLSQKGHSVTVFTPRYTTAPPPSYPFSVRYIRPLYTYGNAAYLPHFQSELEGFEVVHLHYPFFGAHGGIIQFKKKRPTVPLVVTYHMDVRAKGIKGIFFRWHLHRGMPKILQNADTVIVSSSDYARSSAVGFLLENYPDTFVEIPFGVDAHRFQPQEKNKTVLEQIGIPTDHKVILFVGGLDRAHYFKGVEVLLQAFKDMYRAHISCSLLLIGEGDLRSCYEAQATQLGIKDRTYFLGTIPIDALPIYYNLADVFVLPSIDCAEAFGLVLLEAMACGIPCVASDLAGVRTLVSGEFSHVLVPPRNPEALAAALKKIIGNGVLKKEYKQHIRQRIVEKYSWEKMVEGYEQIYRQLDRGL